MPAFARGPRVTGYVAGGTRLAAAAQRNRLPVDEVAADLVERTIADGG